MNQLRTGLSHLGVRLGHGFRVHHLPSRGLVTFHCLGCLLRHCLASLGLHGIGFCCSARNGLVAGLGLTTATILTIATVGVVSSLA